MRRFTVSFLVLAAVASAADIAGTWQFTQTGGGGRGGSQTIVNTFVFKVDGNKFTGIYATPQQALDIVNGVINGNQITFQTSDDHGSIPPRTADYTGTLDGDTLTISRVMNAPGNPGGGGGGPSHRLPRRPRAPRARSKPRWMRPSWRLSSPVEADAAVVGQDEAHPRP